MGSNSVDSGTMKSSSAGAQSGASTLSGYGSQNEQTGTNLQSKLFGNGTAGSTGTMSAMMNPSSLNVTGPTGAYATQYTNAANQNAAQTNQALTSTNRAMANRGQGGQPGGANAALTEQAYQGQANTNANNYANYGMQSYQNALSNFWNANNLAGSTASSDLSQAGSEQSGANSTNTSLYGTSSQQKQSPWGAVLGGAAGLAGAGASIYKTAKG